MRPLDPEERTTQQTEKEDHTSTHAGASVSGTSTTRSLVVRPEDAQFATQKSTVRTRGEKSSNKTIAKTAAAGTIKDSSPTAKPPAIANGKDASESTSNHEGSQSAVSAGAPPEADTSENRR